MLHMILNTLGGARDWLCNLVDVHTRGPAEMDDARAPLQLYFEKVFISFALVTVSLVYEECLVF